MNNSEDKNNVKKVRKTTIKAVESPDTKTIKTDKKIYNSGDRYMGKYKETQKKQYLKKKESMTPDDIQKQKEYKKNYYMNNKQKYLEKSKIGAQRVKKAMALLKQLEKNGKQLEFS